MAQIPIKKSKTIVNKLAKIALLVGGVFFLPNESSHALQTILSSRTFRPHFLMQPELTHQRRHAHGIPCENWKQPPTKRKILLDTIQKCIGEEKKIGPHRHWDHIKLYEDFHECFYNYQNFKGREFFYDKITDRPHLSPEEEIQVSQYILQLMKNLLVHNLNIHETFTNLLQTKITSSFNPPDTRIISVLAVRIKQMIECQRQNNGWSEPEIFVKNANAVMAVKNYYRNLRLWSNEATILNLRTLKIRNISNLLTIHPPEQNLYLEEAHYCLEKFKRGENLETGYYDEPIDTLLDIAHDYISVQEAFQNTAKYFEDYDKSDIIKHIRKQAEETGCLLEYGTFQNLYLNTEFIDYNYVMAKALKKERTSDFLNEIQKQHAAAEKSYY